MLTDRRAFLAGLAGVAAAADLSNRAAAADVRSPTAKGRTRIKAIAFDGFPIIDPRPLAAKAEAVFPGKGESLSAAWRTRQFEYTWLRTLSGRYADFWQTTSAAEWRS